MAMSKRGNAEQLHTISWQTRLRRQLPLITMILPGVLYLFINNYIPMAGIVVAFKKVNYQLGIFKSPWVGWKNFEYLFASKDSWIILRNTLLYNVAFIFTNMVVATLVAVFLNEVKSRIGSRIYQAFLLIPYLLSWVVVGFLGYAFLNSRTGYINNVILPLFGAKPVSWYMDLKAWPWILIIVNAWKNVGYYSVIYLAAIMGIDHSLYEAGRVDGTNWLQEVVHITLPGISPVLITMFLLQIGRIFYSDFGLFYQVPMNTGFLLPVTNVLDTYVYRALLLNNDISMSSAAGCFQAVMGLLVVVGANMLVRRVDADSAMF